MKSLRMALPLLWAYSALRFSCFATDVLTHRNNVEHTGWNSTETTLTPSNVNVRQFGLLANLPVDAPIFAQPLYASGVFIGGSNHNLLIVATENDSVYAFDPNSFALLWKASLLGAGEQPAIPFDSCTDLMWSNSSSPTAPALGITATPVIDRAIGPNGAIYVLAMSMTVGQPQQYYARLHALDLSTGQDMQTETLNSPVTIKATFPSLSGTITFNPQSQRGRPALLLQGGIVYTAWGSQCDTQPYYGWIIAYDENTLKQTAVFNDNPNQNLNGGLGGGGIWGAGGAVAGSPEGDLYFMTGDGLFDTRLLLNGFPWYGDYGDSFMRLGGNLKVIDFFCPSDQYELASLDNDLGCGGVVVLPGIVDNSDATWNLAVGGSKAGTVQIVSRMTGMGGYNNGNTDKIYQEFTLPPPNNAMWSSPAYFNDGANNVIYFGPEGSPLLKYVFANAKLTGPSAMANTICGSNPAYFQFPGASPSVSSNGANASSAIVWAYQNLNPPPSNLPIPDYGTPVLHAFDSNLNELYCSQENPADDISQPPYNASATKFMVPTVCNGEVFVGTTNSVAVFGLLPIPR
jgi:hypothetical protein